ncbi:K(+)-transporting ATPase subunit F [Subtercola lobariae]|nr:K(+)-transporting ATPase subunit F [Subtercola lobariae]
MIVFTILGVVLGVAAVVYCLYALFKPERF